MELYVCKPLRPYRKRRKDRDSHSDGEMSSIRLRTRRGKKALAPRGRKRRRLIPPKNAITEKREEKVEEKEERVDERGDLASTASSVNHNSVISVGDSGIEPISNAKKNYEVVPPPSADGQAEIGGQITPDRNIKERESRAAGEAAKEVRRLRKELQEMHGKRTEEQVKRFGLQSQHVALQEYLRSIENKWTTLNSQLENRDRELSRIREETMRRERDLLKEKEEMEKETPLN
ncbi:MAG: hypothetical protein GY714_09340 [Desulfobacterales bacterium]|nr:hypothetical protein [Desulfobacterales bacterium]